VGALQYITDSHRAISRNVGLIFAVCGWCSVAVRLERGRWRGGKAEALLRILTGHWDVFWLGLTGASCSRSSMERFPEAR
jgi:hypothetical protein